MSPINVLARRHLGLAKTTGLIAAGVLAGGIAVSTIGASAATTSTTTPSSGTTATSSTGSTGSSSAASAPQVNKQPTPVRSDEKALSAAQTATIKAAALKAVPGGTVYRVESDAGDGVYEAHMTKADGSLVTVKFDKNLAVTKVEAGMGTGDPAPAGGRPGSPGGGA